MHFSVMGTWVLCAVTAALGSEFSALAQNCNQFVCLFCMAFCGAPSLMGPVRCQIKLSMLVMKSTNLKCLSSLSVT